MDTSYREDVKAVMDEVLLALPGVTGGKAFGYPAYKFGKKVFCFVVTNGVTIKLSAPRIQALVAEQAALSVFGPTEETVWREWLLIKHTNADDYTQHLPLFEESVRLIGA